MAEHISTEELEYTSTEKRDDIIDSIRMKHGFKAMDRTQKRTFKKRELFFILTRFEGRIVVVSFEDLEVVTRNMGHSYLLNHVSSNGKRIVLGEYMTFERARVEFECVHMLVKSEFGEYALQCEVLDERR